MSALHEAAIELASLGHPVFPLAPRGKAPAIPKEKGGNGLHGATCDLERIDRWWARHPDHNIAIRTGVTIDVFDIDDADELGPEMLRRVMAEDGPAVLTQSGGLHVYYRPTGLGNRARFLPGCDWRGQGGYVVAPPSVGEKGRWEWLGESHITDPIPPAPPCLLEALRPREAPRAPVSVSAGRFRDSSSNAIAGLVKTVLSAQNGQRNSVLNWASYRMAEHIRAGRVHAEAGARALIEAGLAVGLGQSEVVATVRSGLRGAS